MANRNWASNGKVYTGHVQPVLIDCNFVVDSMNGNGLGIRSLKGPYVQNVFMQSLTAAPTPPAGSPNLATSASYVAIGASALTNTGSSVLTGNVALYPGTSFTGFPPGVVIGVENITNAAADQAQIDSTAAYTYLQGLSSTVIPSALDGQTLTPGVYSFSSGAASLAQSGNGTLTLNGAGLYVIQTATTLTTGAGGTPTILLTGGALAANVYWAVGSSATLNVSGSGVFEGTLIALTSVTIDGGSVVGRLFANTGALSISAATAMNLPAGGVPSHVAGTPQPGIIVVQLQDGYAQLYTGGKAVVSPIGATSTSTSANVAAIVTSLGSSTSANWLAVGYPAGLLKAPSFLPAIGSSFIPSASSSIGGGATIAPTALAGSGIQTIETIGDSRLALDPVPSKQSFGGQIILAARNVADAIAAPADGSVISLSFLLGNSSIVVNGE